MERKPVVFIAPLDWGLGHATRVIPIIDYFLERGWEVWLGGKGDALTWLEKRYPFLRSIAIPSYTVRYTSKLWQNIYFLSRLPAFFYWTGKEHLLLKKAFKKQKPDLIISDNRYGLYLKEVPSVLISHQLQPEMPSFLWGIKRVSYAILSRYMQRFNACWIPDFEGEKSLSGKLSEPIKNQQDELSWLGLLSRFTGLRTGEPKEKYDGMLLLSGPEPHRSKLKNIFIQQALDIPEKKFLVVEGNMKGKKEQKANVDVVPFMDGISLLPYFAFVPLLICRSGYSTIMDLAATGRKAVLIPTPGQPEQIYLARYLNGKKAFAIQDQKKFNLRKGFKEQENYKGVEKPENHQMMKAVVDTFIRKNIDLKK